MTALKIIQVGNSSAVILPKEAMQALGVERGDSLYLTRTETGDHRVSALNPEAVRQLETMREIMREDRELLRALADK
jgi:putative addiction module antidote